MVSIDGEVEDKEVFPENAMLPESGNKSVSGNTSKPLPWYGKCAHCFGGYADQECTCEPTVSKMETTAICDACGKKCNGTEKKTITTKQLSGVVMCEECSGGNTTERTEEKEKINEVISQIESAATKAANRVMEEHAEAFRKLAEKEK